MSDNGSSFISKVVLVAFGTIRDKLEGPGRPVYIEYSGGTARIMVARRGKLQLSYRVTVKSGDADAAPTVETGFFDSTSGKEVRGQPGFLTRKERAITVGEVTPVDIVESFDEWYLSVTKALNSAR